MPSFTKVQGASRETDVFEINITSLIFSVEFIYYHEMIRYYMPFFCSFLTRQHVAEQNGLDSSRWPLSLFTRSPGFVQLRQDQLVSSSLSFLLFDKMWCDTPQDGTATWNVPMTPDIETATKEPLSFNNRFTTFYENVVCKHTML